MCGIAGIVSLSGKPFEPRAVKRMCDVLAHRGPDDAGYVFFRLSENMFEEGGYWCGFADAEFKHLNEHLIDHFQPGKISRMNPGSLPDWPLPEQQQLFALLGGGPASIGIKLTDSFLMVPIKSVSGIWFPNEESFESCRLCPREKCPGRRAPYDPDLYDRKYRQK